VKGGIHDMSQRAFEKVVIDMKNECIKLGEAKERASNITHAIKVLALAIEVQQKDGQIYPELMKEINLIREDEK
jgi:hypothetical protein